jgi:phage tail protein X
MDLSAAFPAALEREFRNGLTNVVAVYVALIPAGGREPAMLYGRVVEILFDVWEESYAVTVKDPHFPQGVRLVLPDFAALRRFLSEERDLDLGPAALLPGGAFHVEARVEVNPVSKEQLQRTREFIANPAAGTRAQGGSRSVLGAMASFLLREPDPGSDVYLLRSRPLGPGEVTAR